MTSLPDRSWPLPVLLLTDSSSLYFFSQLPDLLLGDGESLRLSVEPILLFFREFSFEDLLDLVEDVFEEDVEELLIESLTEPVDLDLMEEFLERDGDVEPETDADTDTGPETDVETDAAEATEPECDHSEWELSDLALGAPWSDDDVTMPRGVVT